MKKNKIILSLFVLLITSFSLFSQNFEVDQNIENEYLNGIDFEDILPPLSPPCDCSAYGNFTFVNSFYALETALINQALLKKAKEDAEDEWIEKQKGIIKSKLEEKFNKSFANFDEAKDELFRYSEINNISKNSVAPRNEFGILKHNGFTTQGKYLEDIKILELRGLEIKAGNIHNPKYGYLEVDGIQMKNITNIEALNIKWDNIYSKFSTNYGTTYFNNQVHHYLNNLGQGLTDLVLSLKNEYYDDFDKWDKLDYVQFLINYEYYKKLDPLYYNQKLLQLFNKFKDTDKGNSTVIKNHAIGRSTYPSIFKGDNGLSKEIYDLSQNPADYNEASILARKEADRLRLDADALDGLLNGVSTSALAVNNLLKALNISNVEERNWLYSHSDLAVELNKQFNLLKTYGDLIKAQNWAKGQIELEALTQDIPWKVSSGKVAGLEYTHSHFDGSRGYFKLKDGSIVVNSLSEQVLTASGDLRDKYNDFNPNDRFSYIKLPNQQWAEMLFNPDNLSDGLKNLFKLAAKDLGKNIGRYVLPIEDIKIFIDGKDFDGQDVSRWQAAGFLFLSVIPGGKALKIVGNAADATIFAIKLGGNTLIVDTVKTGLKVIINNNVIKILSNAGVEIARVVNKVITFKYSGFGGSIISNPNKTTTILGRYVDDLGFGTKSVLDSKLFKYGDNKGGFNLLNDTKWDILTQSQKDLLNYSWLEQAFIRGDDIRLISNQSNKYFNGTLTQYGKELNWIEIFKNRYNYSYNSLTKTYIKN